MPTERAKRREKTSAALRTKTKALRDYAASTSKVGKPHYTTWTKKPASTKVVVKKKVKAKKGDTFSSLAESYQTSTYDLLAANPELKLLRAGTMLNIPSPKPTAQRQQYGSRVPTPRVERMTPTTYRIPTMGGTYTPQPRNYLPYTPSGATLPGRRPTQTLPERVAGRMGGGITPRGQQAGARIPTPSGVIPGAPPFMPYGSTGILRGEAGPAGGGPAAFRGGAPPLLGAPAQGPPPPLPPPAELTQMRLHQRRLEAN